MYIPILFRILSFIWSAICQKLSHFSYAQTAVLRSFFRVFIVLGMYYFSIDKKIHNLFFSFLKALNENTPNTHRVQKCLQKLLRALHKDRHHTIQHFRHLLETSLDQVREWYIHNIRKKSFAVLRMTLKVETFWFSTGIQRCNDNFDLWSNHNIVKPNCQAVLSFVEIFWEVQNFHRIAVHSWTAGKIR